MFVNLLLETQQHIGPWLFQIISFEGICISSQIRYLSLRNILDSSVPLDDNNLIISGYNLIRSDHPSNTKRGGVCLYYKHFLPLRVLNISYLKESLNFELKVGLSRSKKIGICFIESPLKVIKNTFYFILKACFVLKIFKFLLWLFGHIGKTAWLER